MTEKKTLIYINAPELFNGLINECNKLKYKDYKIWLVYQDKTNDNLAEDKIYSTEVIKICDSAVDHLLVCPKTYQAYNLENLDVNEAIVYLMPEIFPEYDYYWHLEYNIFMNSSSYKDFFDKYENDKSDLLMPNIEQTDNENVYCGSNAIFRVSKKFATYMKLLSVSENRTLPNLNMFFPTTIKNNPQFTCNSINEPSIKDGLSINFAASRIFNHPDGKIYFPIECSAK